MPQNPKSSGPTPGHLFVLVHGLWGGPKHLLVLEEAIKHSFADSDEKICTLRPSSFAFFKTYDGVKVCGEKVVRDIFYEVETLRKRENVLVSKISIVGYSLGGLISRYVVGRLHSLGAFDHIEPVIFSTFATPHVGVHFFRQTIADRLLNFVGGTFLGQTGRDVFIHQSRILVDLADPAQVYYQGLQKFRKRLLFANSRNDRTVAFYTAYISEYAPFQHWNEVQLRFYPNLPEITVGKRRVKPRIIDLEKSDFRDKPSGFFSSPKTLLKFLGIILLALVVVPIWAPLILTASTIGTLLAYTRLCLTPHPDNADHWNKVHSSVYKTTQPIRAENVAAGEQQRKGTATIDTYTEEEPAELTQSALETLMAVEDLSEDDEREYGDDERESSDDSDELLKHLPKIRVPVEIDYIKNAPLITAFVTQIEKAGSRRPFPLFTDDNSLPCDPDRMFIIRSLNRLQWTKVPVFIDAWNAHDGIVARRGPRSNPRGAATVYLWASIIREELAKE
ncbi:hypothetical protein BABINDRAFT_166404 [Babjeviella inositovora NRRL Y-12698]|uniref:DUF676 domain-containing protein n=1 Tax=Babjeviella inositovora NRRL Y-12698 TaxID=984486 RepID=A0A1E3QSY6_9ASCO|nr:uncharacterized protein BABINDRAFT_166404 [Babjeviella inositovora NRRL Y-12698]ODQ80826.1 hypothetical protein BABINDRAFT_166404 [Babjeviella inositovora NRRL Y-12698]